MGRRIHRRHYVGRRKSERGKSKLIICLVLLFTALVVFLSVMLGLQLREKAERRRAESEFLSTAEPDPAITSQPPVDIKVSEIKIQAPFVSVVDPENITLPEGALTVSSVLKSEEGVSFYRSPAIEAVSKPQDEDLPSAEALMAALKEGDRRVSVIFHRESTEGMDEIATQAVLDIAVSQMCETAKAGAAEILLMGFDTSAENLDFLASAAAKIKAENPETLVGIVLPARAAAGSETEVLSALCRSVSEFFDIIALDMTDLADSESASAPQQLKATVDSMQICFTRYNIRCIFRDGHEDSDLLTQVLDEELLSNYQFTSKTGVKTDPPGREDDTDE